MGHTATIIENKKKFGLILRVLTGVDTTAGGNFESLSLAICIKKNPQNAEYTISPLTLSVLTFRRFFY